MARKLAAIAGAIGLIVLLPAAAQARTTRYYVSLGDSLAVGYQPDSTGHSATTRQGYVDDLFKLKRSKVPGLVKVQFGCAGESTSSISGNPANCAYETFGSQLQAAEAFIRQHRSQIAFVTIDMGANDVDSCTKNGQVDLTCVNNGFAATKRNLPGIAKRLRKAAGPKIQIAGMTYYDPFLESYTKGDAADQALAKSSVGLSDQFNTIIANAYKAQKIKVADVSTAFQTDVFTTMTTLPPFGLVPVDVARVCQLTYMCNPAPVGPNIHANPAGYTLIADTFAKVVKP